MIDPPDLASQPKILQVRGKEWINAVEAVKLWPFLDESTIRQWKRRGKLNGVRVGTRTFYDFNELAEAERAVRSSGRGRKRAPTTG